jgi:antimicrobial peptide system SdpA family protein
MDRRMILIGTRAVLGVCWLAVISFVLRGLHDSPMRIGMLNGLAVTAIVPQGWAFFTRDPQEASWLVYRPDGDRWVRALGTNSDAQYLFGLDRTQRAQEMELQSLLGQVPSSAWVSGRSKVSGPSAGEIRRVVAVNNTAPRPSICGEVAVHKRETIPWAWSRSRATIAMPSTTARMHVRCGPPGAEPDRGDK